jgi:hypothetical protein
MARSEEILWHTNGRAAYVGVRHGKAISLPERAVERLESLGNRYGFWFEGNGADKPAAEKAISGIRWSGSWDDLVKPDKPSDFYFSLFSNGGPSRTAMLRKLVSPGNTILQSLVAHGDDISHEALHGKDHKAALPQFLHECGDGLFDEAKGDDAFAIAVNQFITRGERLMWPEKEGSTPASRIAARANKVREQTILERNGVFFLGSDHIALMRRLVAA